MKTSCLNYYKLILEKVSFDLFLFNKEYTKAKQALASHELFELDKWLMHQGLHVKLSNTEIGKLSSGSALTDLDKKGKASFL